MENKTKWRPVIAVRDITQYDIHYPRGSADVLVPAGTEGVGWLDEMDTSRQPWFAHFPSISERTLFWYLRDTLRYKEE
jgi:hypothetical protein